MAWIEKEFEERATKHIDDIYKAVFDNIKTIRRSNRDTGQDEKTLFMDKHLAIDTHLEFADGTALTFQEKTRRPFYTRYGDFTFEYYNDPVTKEPGEWFKLAAQLYLYGFAGCGAGHYGYERRIPCADSGGSVTRNGKPNCVKCPLLQKHHAYWVIDVPVMRLFLKKEVGIKLLESKYLRGNPPPAKANFFAIPFDIFPDEVFLVRRNVPNKEKVLRLKSRTA